MAAFEERPDAGLRRMLAPWRVLAILLLADLAIVLIYLPFAWAGRIPDLVNLDGEQNLGAWWSGGQYLLAGLVVLLAGRLPGARAAAPWRLYLVLGAALVFVSADEVCGLHERVNKYTTLHLPFVPTFARGHGAWIFVYGALTVALLAWLWRDILGMMRADPAGSVWMTAGFGLIGLGGVVSEAFSYGMSTEAIPAQILLEESLEMAGISCLVAGSLRHILGLLARPAAMTAPAEAVPARG